MTASIAKRIDVEGFVSQREQFIESAETVMRLVSEMMDRSDISRKAWRRFFTEYGSQHMGIGGFRKENEIVSPSSIIDGILWVDYLKETGLWDHLPKRYTDGFVNWMHGDKKDAMPFTHENVQRVMEDLYNSRWDWFAERIKDVFDERSIAHKSNGSHVIGDRVILTNTYGSRIEHKIERIEAVVYHVMGETLPASHKDRLNISGMIGGQRHPKKLDNEFMNLRVFKNGNVHITWTDKGKEAQDRLNEVLALGAERSLGQKVGV